jgi:protein-S-isoprenylcysteine O-methyltransferase Ste14
MYYIAGLTIQIPPQAVEGLAVFTTLRFIQYSVSRARALAAVAKAESGAIRTRPTTFIGRIVTPIHLVTSSISSMTYVLCIAGNMFKQPAWMQCMSLSNDYFQQETKVALRIAACASTFVLLRFVGRTFTHLGNQWHVIGVRTFLTKYSWVEDMYKLTAPQQRREKPRVVQTGPYAVVRHPLYT